MCIAGGTSAQVRFVRQMSQFIRAHLYLVAEHVPTCTEALTWGSICHILKL